MLKFAIIRINFHSVAKVHLNIIMRPSPAEKDAVIVPNKCIIRVCNHGLLQKLTCLIYPFVFLQEHGVVIQDYTIIRSQLCCSDKVALGLAHLAEAIETMPHQREHVRPTRITSNRLSQEFLCLLQISSLQFNLDEFGQHPNNLFGRR